MASLRDVFLQFFLHAFFRKITEVQPLHLKNMKIRVPKDCYWWSKFFKVFQRNYLKEINTFKEKANYRPPCEQSLFIFFRCKPHEP